MKFAQKLESELVPEWQDAYCSYSDLKQDLKRIQQQRRIVGPNDRAEGYNRTGSLGLLKSLASFTHHSGPLSRPGSRRGDVGGHNNSNFLQSAFSPRSHTKDTILTSRKRVGEDDVYVTELREPLSYSAQDKTFFVRLDAQLTKINKFYKRKEGEYIARAGLLEKQMLALIDLEEAMARQGLVTPDYFRSPRDHQDQRGTDHRLPDLKETSDEMPLIADQLELHPMQTQLPRNKSSNGRHQHHHHNNNNNVEEEEEFELDTSIQDYIDQVAASNLKQRRTNNLSELATLAIPRSNSTGTINYSGNQQTPGSRNSSTPTVRFAPTDHQQHSNSYSNSLPNSLQNTPRTSAMKKVSGQSIPQEPNSAASEPVFQDEILLASMNMDIDLVDIENQKEQTLKSEKELNHAKKLLRLAFVEFYRGLGLLSNYRSLNITAFAKILKKYDKNTGWHVSPIYMKEVESSYFVTSTKVHKLINKVEEIYAKHFTEGVRKKAIAHLRPTRKQGTHLTTFFTGLFTGCSVALFISFFFLVENQNALGHGQHDAHEYLENVFPVFSTLLLVILHIFCYAFNVYAWARTRVNYPFIFGFSPGTELRYREVLLLATGLSTFLLGGMNLHIAVTVLTINDPVEDPEVSHLETPRMVADIIPLILVVMCLAILFLPFNLMYRSSRLFFLGCFRRLASAPFVKVTLADFFLGDQLTSQVLVFRNLQYVSCYYPTGFFLTGRDEKCDDNDVFRGFGYTVALLPFWWRFLQCLRRYYDERDTHQLENAGKYMAAIVALGLRQAYSNYEHMKILMWFSAIASIIATIYASYWDLCVDWGLLNHHSKNKWLRDKIITGNKSIYFIAIGANIVLRLAWMLSIMRLDRMLGFVRYKNAFNVILACLEIIRRGIWNFFRIENEHLNNVGKYRAVKAVPLPFNDD